MPSAGGLGGVEILFWVSSWVNGLFNPFDPLSYHYISFFSSSLVFQFLQDIEYVGYERKTYQPHPCQLNWVGCYACNGLD